jgi:hypothetical protein
MAVVIWSLLTLVPSSAFGGTPDQPDIVDVAGDANGINSQGRNEVPDQNIGTAPASIPSADIQAIWFETLYSIVKVRDNEGRVLRVRHIPEALRVSIRTTAPAKPTFGPGVIFRVGATIGPTCEAQLQLSLAGSAPGSSTFERAELSRIRNCPGGAGPVPGEIPFALIGNVTTMTFAFESSAGVLATGLSLGPFTPPHSRVILPTGGSGTTIPAIDQTARVTSWTIGSDVPPDIDCTEEPSHPNCA